MGEVLAQMAVQVNPLPDADAEELAELATQLRSLLLDLDVDRVVFAEEGEPPSGAKAVDAIAIGTLIVRFASSWPVLKALVSEVASWVSTHAVRSVKIGLDGDVLEVTRISAAEQRRLIDLWVARHVDKPTAAPSMG